MGVGISTTVYGDAQWAEAASFAALLQSSQRPSSVPSVSCRCARTDTQQEERRTRAGGREEEIGGTGAVRESVGKARRAAGEEGEEGARLARRSWSLLGQR